MYEGGKDVLVADDSSSDSAGVSHKNRGVAEGQLSTFSLIPIGRIFVIAVVSRSYCPQEGQS